jgi:hypothetical protein
VCLRVCVWYRGNEGRGGLPTVTVVLAMGGGGYGTFDGTSGARVFHNRRGLFCAIHACPGIGIIETGSTTATTRLGELERQASTTGLD